MIVLCVGLVFGQAALATAPVAVLPPAWQAPLDRAKAHAASGEVSEATAPLMIAIELGYADYFTLMYSGALAPVRGGADWPRVLAAFDARQPWAASLRGLFVGSKAPWAHYLRANQFMATKADIPPALVRTYFELYAASATYVGQYEEADRHYGAVAGAAPALDAGYVTARDATGPIAAAAEGARVVFLNESHARSNTRAANLMLVAALARQGFTHLALEAVSVDRDAGGCRTAVTSDRELSARGYPLTTTGAYLNDPVYGELVRVALASGLTVVGYDHQFDGPSVEQREEAQAANLACLLKTEPDARLVVIGGFAHISEREDFRIPGGLMGARFKRITGLDPVTVDTTTLLTLDERRLDLGNANGPAGAPLLLENADGGRWARDGYDFTVFVPAPTPRAQEGPHWLTLGGRRQRTVVPMPACEGAAACLLEASLASEAPEAVPVDRCVFASGQPPCVLFLPPGPVRVQMWGADGESLGVPVQLEVAQGSEPNSPAPEAASGSAGN